MNEFPELTFKFLQCGVMYAPKVHGNRGIVGQKRLFTVFVCKVNAVVPALDFCSFHHISEESLFVHRAHSTGNSSVFRQGIAQLIGHHAVLTGRTIT